MLPQTFICDDCQQPTILAEFNECHLDGAWVCPGCFTENHTGHDEQATRIEMDAEPADIDTDDMGDPAEGWLADSWAGAWDDDPSPYDGNYSEE